MINAIVDLMEARDLINEALGRLEKLSEKI